MSAPENSFKIAPPSSEIPDSKIEEPFLGSVVFNPLECGQAIIQKCLEAEAPNSLECRT